MGGGKMKLTDKLSQSASSLSLVLMVIAALSLVVAFYSI